MTTTKKPSKPEPKKATKPTKPTAKKEGARRDIIPVDAKLTVLAKENPRRGGLAAKTFALYAKAKTFGGGLELIHSRRSARSIHGCG